MATPVLCRRVSVCSWLLSLEPAFSWCCPMRRLCSVSSGSEASCVARTDTPLPPSIPQSRIITDSLLFESTASPPHTSTSHPHPLTSTDQRVLRTAILGIPNAGKSTLINKLIGQKVFAVSPKVHTTRRRAVGVFTEGNTQVILLDTPGVVPYRYGRRLRLSRQFMTDPQHSLVDADLALVLVDASNKRTREHLDPALLHTLASSPHIPTVLVLNKVDLLRYKHILLHITEALTGAIEQMTTEEKGGDQKSHDLGDTGEESCAPGCVSEESHDPVGGAGSHNPVGAAGVSRRPTRPKFDEVFMISALTEDGVDKLKSHLLSCATPGQWEYSSIERTDQPSSALVEDIVREKLFLHLRKEIPYVIVQENVIWEKTENGLIVFQNLNCTSTSQASIVIGPGGSTIQTITEEARTDIEAVLQCPVDLTLNVRTKKKIMQEFSTVTFQPCRK